MKNVKKIMAKHKSEILPDEKIKDNVRRELGFDGAQYSAAYAHGGERTADVRRNKIIVLCAAVLAVALLLGTIVPALMKNKNISSNGLLFDTCKHLRYVRDNYFRSYHLSGIVIDSFVYQAIGNWRWLSSGESSTSAAGTYERILLDYYNQHFMWGAMPLSAPGSNQQVSTDNSRDCLGKVLRYIAG